MRFVLILFLLLSTGCSGLYESISKELVRNRDTIRAGEVVKDSFFDQEGWGTSGYVRTNKEKGTRWKFGEVSSDLYYWSLDFENPLPPGSWNGDHRYYEENPSTKGMIFGLTFEKSF